MTRSADRSVIGRRFGPPSWTANRTATPQRTDSVDAECTDAAQWRFHDDALCKSTFCLLSCPSFHSSTVHKAVEVTRCVATASSACSLAVWAHRAPWRQTTPAAVCRAIVLLWPPYGIGQAIIFLPCGFFFFFLLPFFFPCLISVVSEWMSTILLHMVWP